MIDKRMLSIFWVCLAVVLVASLPSMVEIAKMGMLGIALSGVIFLGLLIFMMHITDGIFQ